MGPRIVVPIREVVQSGATRRVVAVKKIGDVIAADNVEPGAPVEAGRFQGGVGLLGNPSIRTESIEDYGGATACHCLEYASPIPDHYVGCS